MRTPDIIRFARDVAAGNLLRTALLVLGAGGGADGARRRDAALCGQRISLAGQQPGDRAARPFGNRWFQSGQRRHQHPARLDHQRFTGVAAQYRDSPLGAAGGGDFGNQRRRHIARGIRCRLQPLYFFLGPDHPHAPTTQSRPVRKPGCPTLTPWECHSHPDSGGHTPQR